MANNTKENKKEAREVKQLSLLTTEQELENGNWFWCNKKKGGGWLLPIQCTSRQHKEEESCVRCAQGNVVRAFDPAARIDKARPDIEL